MINPRITARPSYLPGCALAPNHTVFSTRFKLTCNDGDSLAPVHTDIYDRTTLLRYRNTVAPVWDLRFFAYNGVSCPGSGVSNNPIIVGGMIDMPDLSCYQVTFGGQARVTIPPGGWVVSDPTPRQLVLTEEMSDVRARAYVDVANRGTDGIPLAWSTSGPSGAEGYAAGDATTIASGTTPTVARTGFNLGPYGVYCSFGLIGRVPETAKLPVFIGGDSIARGYNGGHSNGYISMALGGAVEDIGDSTGYPRLFTPRGGTACVDASNPANDYFASGMPLARVYIEQLGINDLCHFLSGTATQADLDALKVSKMALWGRAAAAGVPVVSLSLLPCSLASQVGDAMHDSWRQYAGLYNAWAKTAAMTAPGKVVFFDSTPYLEAAGIADPANPLAWTADMTTTDPIHPDEATAVLIGQAIGPALQKTVDSLADVGPSGLLGGFLF